MKYNHQSKIRPIIPLVPLFQSQISFLRFISYTNARARTTNYLLITPLLNIPITIAPTTSPSLPPPNPKPNHTNPPNPPTNQIHPNRPPHLLHIPFPTTSIWQENLPKNPKTNQPQQADQTLPRKQTDPDNPVLGAVKGRRLLFLRDE